MLDEASKADIPLFCYEGTGTEALGVILKKKRAEFTQGAKPTVSIVIGPEGGFSAEEAELAHRAGLIPAGLGKRILRTETAAAFVLGALVYEFELG